MHKFIRKGGRLMIDESTPEFEEVGYDEPMQHMEEDIDVLARREAEDLRHGA